VTIIVLAATGLAVVADAQQQTPAYASSYVWERFNPGNIISDALFYDGGAMSTSKVQSFLNTKGAACTSTSTSTCLKDFRGTIEARAATTRCSAITRRTNQTAAQMITTVARACSISPKVLLVTLQKEQTFVTSTAPTARMYQIAMGYACPDTAPCDSVYYGLYNQLYFGASQMKRYKVESHRYNFRAGRTYSILYSPNCSSRKQVTIENWATAALYNYTPYTPNDASLRNYPGTAPSCGAYGNRNFFALYSIWFGSTVAEGSLYRIDENLTWWVVSGDKRWRIPHDNTALKSAIAPMGEPRSVSSHYMATFDNAGDFRAMAKSPDDDRYFLLDGGKRHTVRGCAKLEDFGFDCDDAPEMPWRDLTKFTMTSDLLGHVHIKDQGNFVLMNGKKHPVPNSVSAGDAGLHPITPVQFNRAAMFDPIPTGPVITQTTLVRVASNDTWWLLSGERRWRIAPEATDLKENLGPLGSPRSVSVEHLRNYKNSGDFPGIAKSPSDSRYFLLDNGKRHVVRDCAKLTDMGMSCENVPTLPWSHLKPYSLTSDLQGHVKIGSTGNFLLTGGQKRPVADDATAVAFDVKPRVPVTFVKAYLFDSIPAGPAMGEELLYSIGNNDTWWFTFGSQRWRVPPTNTALKESLSDLGPPLSVSQSQITKYTNAGDFRGVAKSPNDGRYFLIDDGKRHTVRTCGDLEDMGFACTSVPALPWKYLTPFELTPDLQGHVAAAGAGDYWLSGGQKRKVLDAQTAAHFEIEPQTPVPFARSGLFAGIPEGLQMGTKSIYRIGDNSTWHIVIDGKRWRILHNDTAVKNAVYPLGAVYSVASEDALKDQFGTSLGDFQGVLKSPDDNRYFILDDGQRFTVRGCAALEAMGEYDTGTDCGTIPTATWTQLRPYTLVSD
jgi:hypothetical protein